jgi:saccharopine dehydrogenase (NAD+, L-glutamate forming)
MDPRPIDVLLYGASGFTGRLAVAELARHAPRGLRWALAGRESRKARGRTRRGGWPGPTGGDPRG